MSRSVGILAIAAALAALIVPAPASAQTTFEIVDGFYITGLSDDATIACGADASAGYEAVRWTAETGAVHLGLAAVTLTGKGGGYTRMSGDGNLICSTIANEDSTICTWGLWTKGVGWERLMPPYPPGGGTPDGDGGSPYAISRDGSTVVGLIWMNGAHGHAGRWTRETGTVDLGAQTPNSSSRANVVNRNGTVIAGWSSSPITGAWQPTVWEDGVMTVLNPSDVRSEVQGINRDGTVLSGMLHNAATNIREPAIWTKVGGAWTGQMLGTLPGSPPFDTACIASGVTDDGTLVVGEYLYDLWTRTGFVWTLDEGLMTADDFFAARGVPVPAGFHVRGLSVVSHDGRYLAGWGYDDATPNVTRSFIVRFPPVSAVPGPVSAGGLRLDPAYPNPFNPETSLRIALDHAGDVALRVYDARGALVRELHSGSLEAGSHAFRWDGRDGSGLPVPSGVYLARAQGRTGAAQTRRLTLIK